MHAPPTLDLHWVCPAQSLQKDLAQLLDTYIKVYQPRQPRTRQNTDKRAAKPPVKEVSKPRSKSPKTPRTQSKPTAAKARDAAKRKPERPPRKPPAEPVKEEEEEEEDVEEDEGEEQEDEGDGEEEEEDEEDEEDKSYHRKLGSDPGRKVVRLWPYVCHVPACACVPLPTVCMCDGMGWAQVI